MCKFVMSVLLFFPILIFSQPEVDRSTEFLNEYLNHENLDPQDITPQITAFDLSTLWTRAGAREVVYGFIGMNYQRFYIHYISVIKNPHDPRQYLVYGKSRVKENVCEFLGTIQILHVRKWRDRSDGATGDGIILARYEFFENPNQTHTGIFKGIMMTEWFFGDAGQIQYFMSEADGAGNNQCVGIWSAYGSATSRPCHWGDIRIPYSGDLDIGVGDFAPNPKYAKNGWESYIKAFGGPEDEHAMQLERVEWWK